TRLAGSDVTPPTVRIDSGPAGATNDSTPKFDFSTNESSLSVVFECSVDDNAFSPCTSPVTTATLVDGAHTFAVRATDDAGNTSQAARRAFTVDTAIPVVAIDSGPPQTTNKAKPTFAFSANETVTFACELDKTPFADCSSPWTAPALADGSHTFTVRASD